VRFLDRQPDDKFADSINACDVAVVMLQEGMGGISVPSRLYNLLAAGRPLLVVADADTEPARVVREESLGWEVRPRDAQGVCDAIAEARRSPQALAEISARARSLAMTSYSYDSMCERMRRLYGG
jgi:glycosyltransferase involved in cell wall biosynthesis